jgi:hypothetical protein
MLGTALASTMLWGCAQQVPGPGPMASVAPQLSVERFLQASNGRDYDGMSRIFGTAEGPLGDTGSTFGCFFKKIGSWFGGQSCVRRQDLEIRMAAIANILTHSDYRIVGEERVPGRDRPTIQVLVDLMRRNDTVRGVPFLVVSSVGGQWLVEFVDLEHVMAGG